tara:strand:- start:204 stop:488 length:285 start_codon:yes stop_codon:yes gene_type:complete
MDIDTMKQKAIVKNFENEKEIMEVRKRNKQPIKKSNDENDYISFDTFDEFMNKRIWPFIHQHVILHPEFETILQTFFKTDTKEDGKLQEQTVSH